MKIKAHTAIDDLVPEYYPFYLSKKHIMHPSYGFITDEEFDRSCPKEFNAAKSRHWTNVNVARLAASFLTRSSQTKVLDIGSGVGKFCVAAAAANPGSVFVGVEQRRNLFDASVKIAQEFQLPNTSFIHSNIIEIDFSEYEAFYFFNSFHENIEPTEAIDESIPLGATLYSLYTQYVLEQFSKLPSGTRVVTYWGCQNVPDTYKLVFSDFCGLLKCWEKSG